MFKNKSFPDMADFMFEVINKSYLLISLLLVIYPLLYILSASFSSPEAVTTGRVWLLPVDPTLKAYEAVFKYPAVWTGYKNSIIYVIIGSSISLVLTVLAAYPLSRKDFKLKSYITFLFVFTILFDAGIIPTYLQVVNLGLIDSRWALVLPNAIIVWNVIITRTFFSSTIPDELLESSKLDGCSDFRFVISMVLPLSKAVLAVNLLFYGVWQWNNYFNALIYLQSKSLYPLQIVLREVLIRNEVAGVGDLQLLLRQQDLLELLKYALIVVSTVPVLLLYPLAQKYFVKGVMLGSLKG